MTRHWGVVAEVAGGCSSHRFPRCPFSFFLVEGCCSPFSFFLCQMCREGVVGVSEGVQLRGGVAKSARVLSCFVFGSECQWS